MHAVACTFHAAAWTCTLHAMTSTLWVRRPTAVPAGDDAAPAFTLDRPIAGLTIGLREDRAWRSWQRIGDRWCEWLARDGATTRTIETQAQVGNPGSEDRSGVEALAHATDAGIVGLGTCGSCTTFTIKDAVTFEALAKPVIAIVNTWSDINQCHGHFRQRAEDVRRGVLQAGGFPIELPAISLSEPIVKPTTMLYRNFLAMETEELLRSHPIDGAVLMGGCDKTTPGLTMGALSAGLPFIFVPAGPMLSGQWRGQTLGSGSDAWK